MKSLFQETLCVFLFSLLFITSCGNESNVSDEAILQDESLGELDATERLIASDAYDGKLIIHLKHEAGGQKQETAKTIDDEECFQASCLMPHVSILKSIVESHPSAQLKRSVEIEPEKLDARRKQLEKLSGETLEDWNSVYRIEVSDGTEAVKIYRELKSRPEVKMVYPKLKHMLLSLDTTPDLTGIQGYLYADETHGGVNAPAAWNMGIIGQNVMVLDGEDGWNFDHEDLPPNLNHVLGNSAACSPADPTRLCWESVAHGTAISGILGGISNEHGITGIAHGAEIYAMDFDGTDLMQMTSGTGEIIEIPPGSIVLIELGAYGALSVPNSDTQYGGLPSETYPISFAAVKQATAAGITVIEGAANGYVSLNDPNVYLPWQVNLSLPENDTGSTLVGSSKGINHQKTVHSNCSPRIDTYSWGEGVVTAGFPFEGNPAMWVPIPGGPNPPNDDPNSYFINNFGGTSSATAIVGGAAALIQSYAKREIGNGETRYLMPRKMREILANSGRPQAPVPQGQPYQVCQTPGGLHVGAPACPSGTSCMAYEPNMPQYRCGADAECYGHDTFFTISAQCINGYCGMSWCAPRCNTLPGGCASIGWFDVPYPSGDCVCRPPYGTYELNNCNIGKQPKLDVAMPLVDEFLNEVKTQYPEIENNTPLIEDRMISLRDMGLGIICKPADVELHRPGQGDPSCPESELWPTGNYIAKDLDFDGDGRADLVQWTNGSWKLDLSSRCLEGATCGSDNFGAWDIEIIHPPVQSKWVWPYVEDMNSDGREDFVEYDKEHGIWFIAFTDDRLLKQGLWYGWNYVIDYGTQWKDDLKMDPLKCVESETPGTGENCSNYSRPAPGDYDGDGWVDLAVACSDGNWRIDFGGATRADFGSYERTIKYLTDDQLRAAPGWAYLSQATPLMSSGEEFIVYKYPDIADSPNNGCVSIYPSTDFSSDYMQNMPCIYGTSEDILVIGKHFSLTYLDDLGLKKRDGTWRIAFFVENPGGWFEFTDLTPVNIFGDSTCRPIVADFDDDNKADRAVMCPEEFRIAYSSVDKFSSNRNSNGARYVEQGYNTRYFTLPGRPYSGGISYSQVQAMIKFSRRINPTEPPSIPVDMTVLQNH